MQIVNAPGRFDTSPRAVAHDIQRWTTLPHVSVVFVTEVASSARAAALETDGWTLTHRRAPGIGECAILTKQEHWKVLERHWFKLTLGHGRRRLSNPVYAPAVVVEDPLGRKVIFSDAHLPAHIEGLWSAIPLPRRTKSKMLLATGGLTPAIRAWLRAVRAWRVCLNRLRRRFPGAELVVTGDFNLNAHRGWVQALLQRMWPELKVAATDSGDLGSRTVGFVLTTLDFDGGEVLHATASDHKAGLYRLVR